MAEDILHFGAVRYRVTGSGVLRTTLLGLDDNPTQVLSTITMSSSPSRQPAILSNLISQRCRYRVETTVINEVFRINRIILFVKPIYTDYPR